jgi:hypothetical protein
LLDDAVAAFLKGITIERTFDEPFMALLRAEGFTDIHLIHGQFEMGKDVIACRDGKQWVFQTKAGDVNLSSFRTIRDQLYDARMSDIAAPGFDKHAPRVAVLVTTGRLVGGANIAAQEYADKALERNEPPVEFWGKDTLIGKFSGNADAALRTSVDGQLHSLVGAIDDATVDMDSIEVFSRRWLSWEPSRITGVAIIETAIVCERLRAADRLDLASHLALCAVRAGWVAAPDTAAAAVAAGKLFETYARLLWAECDDRLLREKGIIGYSGFSAWVTYQLRCARLAEIIALLALRTHRAEPGLSRAIAQWLVRFADAQPGLCRPLGDRYAVSVVPVVLLLAADHREVAEEILRATAGWVCNRYERGNLGLGDVDATPGEELSRILGSPFQHVVLQRRPTSQTAGVLLDLAALLELDNVYADIRNDTLAVSLYPSVLTPGNGPDWLSRTGLNNRWDFNAAYADVIPHEGPAAPHLTISETEPPIPFESWWDGLAVSAAVRDRHFPRVIRDCIQAILNSPSLGS